jgi:uncharacterized protein (UPF0276 family)
MGSRVLLEEDFLAQDREGWVDYFEVEVDQLLGVRGDYSFYCV